MGLKLLASADRSGAMTKGWRGTEVDSEVGTERRARWPAAMYGRSCGPTGVSTRCARPTLPLRPWRVTRRPSLRSESNYGPCGPSWTEASRSSTSSRRTGILQTGAWACRGPSLGAAEAVNAGSYWVRDLIDPTRSRPTPISGDSYNLARMNMLLHGVKDSEFECYHGDTLTNDWDLLREMNPAKKPYFGAVVATRRSATAGARTRR